MLDRLFQLKAKGTSLQTEVLAGATTFLTMAYIVVVNPAILGQAGLPVQGVAVATCIAAAFASILMGLVANTPLALAPGMGLNAYFTFTVVIGMGMPWRTALGCVFLSGVLFLVLTLVGARRLIVEAIPKPLFAALAGGIGLFIALIGLKSAGLVVSSPATGLALGPLQTPTVAVALFGLAVMAALEVWKVKGAVLIGVVAATGAAFALNMTHFSGASLDVHAMTATAFQLDIGAALKLGGKGGFGLLEVIFVFLFVDLFDNVGTLVAVTRRAGLQRPDGSIPNVNRILLADSVATLVGSVAGVSTVVSYIESAAGVAAGGRTGLTSVVTGLLFLAAIFVTPWVQGAPAAATAPALILIGALMMTPLAEVEWKDPTIALPAFLTFVMIPLTYSIANGLAFGLTAYAALRILSGKARTSDAAMLALAGLFVLRFLYLSAA